MQSAVAAEDCLPRPSQPSWLHVTMTTRGARKTSDLAPLEALQHNILVLRGCTGAEKAKVVTNCDRFHLLKHSTTRPHAFTEHGALMAANNLLEAPKTGKLPIGFHVRDHRASYRTTPRTA